MKVSHLVVCLSLIVMASSLTHADELYPAKTFPLGEFVLIISTESCPRINPGQHIDIFSITGGPKNRQSHVLLKDVPVTQVQYEITHPNVFLNLLVSKEESDRLRKNNSELKVQITKPVKDVSRRAK